MTEMGDGEVGVLNLSEVNGVVILLFSGCHVYHFDDSHSSQSSGSYYLSN